MGKEFQAFLDDIQFVCLEIQTMVREFQFTIFRCFHFTSFFCFYMAYETSSYSTSVPPRFILTIEIYDPYPNHSQVQCMGQRKMSKETHNIRYGTNFPCINPQFKQQGLCERNHMILNKRLQEIISEVGQTSHDTTSSHTEATTNEVHVHKSTKVPQWNPSSCLYSYPGSRSIGYFNLCLIPLIHIKFPQKI